MKVGDLVKIRDDKKQEWVKLNPWMALKWGLTTMYIVTDIRKPTPKNRFADGKGLLPLYKIVDTENGNHRWAKPEEIEVISESR